MSVQDGRLSSEEVGVRVDRLRKRADFLALRSGVRHSTPFFTVQASRERSNVPFLRAGLTVTKKVGNAVERNRIKRRLRPLLADAATYLPERLWSGRDLVLVARRAALDATHADLQHSLREALERIARRFPTP